MRLPAWSGLTAFSRAQRGVLAPDSAWRRNPCAIKWRLNLKFRKKKTQAMRLVLRENNLACRLCFCTIALTILPVMYSTNAVARPRKGVALTNIIMNSRAISSLLLLKSYHFLSYPSRFSIYACRVCNICLSDYISKVSNIPPLRL